MASFDAVVVGAGPAGLMAAWRLASGGRRVAVLEHLARPGRKLLVSGAGKCNLTNLLAPGEMVRRCGGSVPAASRAVERFMRPALYAFPPEALRAWFAARGVPTEAADGFHVFPRSQRAGDVLEALLGALHAAGGTLHTGCAAVEPVLRDGRIAGVRCRDGALFETGELVIAGGGMGYPALGGGGLAYELARLAGHRIVPPTPALAGVCTREEWPGRCRGIVLEDAEVRLDRKCAGQGELVFSHRGVSGPAVIDLAGEISQRLLHAAAVPVALRVRRDCDEAWWRAELETARRKHGTRQVTTCVMRHLPEALARTLCAVAGVGEARTAAELPGAERDALLVALTALPLEVVATEGWEKAMATRGGVARDEVDPDTLAGRPTPGLYFAGEVLDIDGPCGGFNLQWAFSSGYLAGSR